jgi:hypothetical protein
MKTPLLLAAALLLAPSALASEEEPDTTCTGARLVAYHYEVANVTYQDLSELAGTLEAGEEVKAVLELEGCGTETVTFAAYEAEPGFALATQTLLAADTKVATNGTVVLSLQVPPCLYQLNLVYGEAIQAFQPPAVTYQAEHRFIDGLQDGKVCEAMLPPTLPSTSPVEPTTVEAPPTQVPFFPGGMAIALGLAGLLGVGMVIVNRRA